jgi:hypothetical protein
MAKHTFIVLSNATSGNDDTFNDWYSNTHVHDVLKVPGFVSAQRFKVLEAPGPTGAMPGWRYLALYEIETDDLAASLGELGKRIGGPAMAMSDTMDMASAVALTFTPITEKVTAGQLKAAE